ncbi:uncharacterized protein BCR38DRAFT_380561 [Pseudomassariella vexata]|uniref:Uncharacterized protein n=1 Tax=Pseudomassariella vexata TaxID=1141098 RepID=A0A1Y2D7Q1_9PEZI|nr:uncharacterized protein BCR38DRAFT_380561 [Pseudomassariella vexata]ORY55136.1 hypothetical protein BCR38DRAFT_380561 [Pseudomassariella vexata]
MGIPYSKEINHAFDQVTPLVAAGFEVLQTTKNIAILLACVQVFTTIILGLILVALMGVIFTVNPDLDYERQQLVTPMMQWLASWIFKYGRIASWFLRVFLVVGIASLGLFLGQGSMAGSKPPSSGEEDPGETPENK